MDRSRLFNALRQKHPYFIYESFNIEIAHDLTKIVFTFQMAGNIVFRPSIQFPTNSSLNEEELQNLAFNVGLVELISYWKAACPPRLIIKPGKLNERQILWWKKLWFNGLGEFFYTNGIETNIDDFLRVEIESDIVFEPFHFEPNNKVLIPLGGGKDSVVSLELIKGAGLDVVPFIVNPRQASINSALNAGFAIADILQFKRTIHPELLRLNNEGYLNGHTPFSALLAFVTLLAARLSGASHIALSNEWSANEATIPGTKINHQYSKSFEFEKDFREYVAAYICPHLNYFSFLRPLNELQIARLFSGFPHHLHTFRSCNVGSKTDSWCGNCPKCLFTAIILAPLVGLEKLNIVFEKDIFEEKLLIEILDELTGVADEKPFECVGTIDEVNAALEFIINNYESETLPLLLSHYHQKAITGFPSFQNLLQQYNHENFLPVQFEEILKKALL